MKYAYFLVLTLSIPLFAEESTKKWIPIAPIIPSESKPEQNISKPSNKLTQNLQAIKTLLEHADKHQMSNEKLKSWYSFEPSEE